jgi:superfamily I DNA/RNA helicase
MVVGANNKDFREHLDRVLGYCGIVINDIKALHQLFGNKVLVGSPQDFKNAGVSEDAAKTWRSFAKAHASWIDSNSNGRFNLLNVGVRDFIVANKPDSASEKVIRIACRIFEVESGTMADRLASIDRRLRPRTDDDNDSEKPLCVELITAHGSKGLEFDAVAIIGLEEGKFPAEDSWEAEERRLLYVAITRAKHRLYVSITCEGALSKLAQEAFSHLLKQSCVPDLQARHFLPSLTK